MQEQLIILLAEDNEEDAELFRNAVKRAGIKSRLFHVKDGREAVDYLEGAGQYADRLAFPFPQVLISDLKMPRMNGLELLRWLQQHPHCSLIPAILLSSSKIKRDVESAYQFGANTFFEKPSSFVELVELIQTLHSYWLRSELPALKER